MYVSKKSHVRGEKDSQLWCQNFILTFKHASSSEGIWKFVQKRQGKCEEAYIENKPSLKLSVSCI